MPISSREPELSIIIPVLHEEAQISFCLDHLARIAGDIRYEVVVVDGDAEGSTLKGIGERYSDVVQVYSRPGRGTQLNAGAQVARGDILVFLHVDTVLPDLALHQVLETCWHPSWVGGAFDFVIASERLSLKVIGAVASWRSRLTRIPYGDQAIFLERKVFEQVQGFPDIPIMEDVALMQTLRRCGMRIRILSAAVKVSPRRWEKEGVLRCTLRNWTLMVLYSCGVHPRVLARWYRPLSSSV